MTREVGMMAKPDEREGKQKRLWERGSWHARRRTMKMNWVGEVNEWYSHSNESWHQQSGSEQAGKLLQKNERENSKGTRGQHPRVCYLHLRRRISRTSKWQEQCKPQPLMFSHHSDGHPEQLWCTLLWALKVLFCFLTHFVYVRIWIFQNALRWRCGFCTAQKSDLTSS